MLETTAHSADTSQDCVDQPFTATYVQDFLLWIWSPVTLLKNVSVVLWSRYQHTGAGGFEKLRTNMHTCKTWSNKSTRNVIKQVEGGPGGYSAKMYTANVMMR